MAILDDTRDDWNARSPLKTRTSVPWADRVGVSWHWIGPGKGPSATGPHSACLTQVRDWQAQHQAQGWKDIGYNVLICQHARAIEGRGLTYAGSHSPGVNYVHVGVQFMVGTDTPGGASAAMLARAVRLRADIGELGKNIRRDWGHRDDPEASTSCPGDGLHKWVHTGGPTTALTTQEGDDMSAAEVQEIKDYVRALLVDGYTVNGVEFPGVAKVDIETQKRVTALRAEVGALSGVVSAMNTGTDLTAEDITAAAKAGATAALDEKITDATTVLGVKVEGLTP